MTEPREVAPHAQEVVPGVYHWRISNANIGGATSSSHAVVRGGSTVLIDPVRLADEALAALPPVTAVALTARCHQRASWRYRREFGAEVWLPEDATAADEQPDRRYAEGDELPGGLQAIRTPGPEWPHYCFLLEGDPGVLFCPDLVGAEGGELHFIPSDDPEAVRRSVERFLELPFSVLCLAHGAPVADDPKAAIRRLLGSPA